MADTRSATPTSTAGVPASERYPMKDMPFVAEWLPDDDRFAAALEEFLLGYGYNTARAYLGDLVDIYDWAVSRQLDFFELSEVDLKPYLALLRRRKYSENTIRRRMTALRQFLSVTDTSGDR